MTTSSIKGTVHSDHDHVVVSISWGAYEYCEPCQQVLRIENDEGAVVWLAGHPGDTAAVCRHYLGPSMETNCLSAATTQ